MLSGCADRTVLDQVIEVEKVGFLHGLWHGVIFPFSFVLSFFMDDVAIYATYNNDELYLFGYIIGVGAFVKCVSINFFHYISER